MDPQGLAAKLADALEQIVPPEFRVWDEEGMVMISTGDAYRAAADVAEVVDREGSLVENVEAAVIDAIQLVQEYVTETTKQSWPHRQTAPSRARRTVDEHEIKMWFEDANGNVVLAAPTIRW